MLIYPIHSLQLTPKFLSRLLKDLCHLRHARVDFDRYRNIALGFPSPEWDSQSAYPLASCPK